MVKIAEVVGKNARIRLGGTVVLGMRDWAIDYTCDTVEKTDFDDAGVKQFLATLTGWTGSFNGFGQPGWSLSAIVGTTYSGSFYVSASDGSYYSGNVIITGASPGTAVDGQATLSYTFQGTGALVYT